MIFKYAEIRRFLSYVKSLGSISPLADWQFSSSNVTILRHDVDFDVEAAYRLALIEAELDVRSTYFFLTTCHTYNLLSSPNRLMIFEMARLGFEIGLHFDPTIYGDVSIDQLKKFVDQEALILSLITGAPVRSVSLHNPSVHGQYPLFDGYCNAYDKRIFSDDCYLADSRMDFRGKNPYTFVERVKERPIQILLHPLHYSEDGLGYPSAVRKHIKNYLAVIDDTFRVNLTYQAQMSDTDLFPSLIGEESK